MDPGAAEAIARTHRRLRDAAGMHFEAKRFDGQLGFQGMPLFGDRGEAQLADVMRGMADDGAMVANNHTFRVKEGGMKAVDGGGAEFKRRMDPCGLMNPGKLRFDTPTQATVAALPGEAGVIARRPSSDHLSRPMPRQPSRASLRKRYGGLRPAPLWRRTAGVGRHPRLEPFLQGAIAGSGTVAGLMPTYDYACARCGPFAELRRIVDRDRAADCPKCGDAATRVLAASPHVGGMASLHERETGDGRYARMRHAAGCRCCV